LKKDGGQYRSSEKEIDGLEKKIVRGQEDSKKESMRAKKKRKREWGG